MTEQEARQMLPEVRAYVESLEAARVAEDKAVRAAVTKYPQQYYAGEEGQRQLSSYSKAVNEAYSAHAEAIRGAWNALKCSGDPLVRWIAVNCDEYRDHATQVLTALPATLDELDALAERSDWCGVWGAFKEQAIDAGVVPGVTPPSPARKAVFDQIDREGCGAMGQAARRRMGEALDALVQEALTGEASATETRPTEVTA